jgi:glycyl-tRNA synthetase
MANILVNKTAHPFDKTRFEALLNRRFFYAPAFEIYGGAYGHALAASSFIIHLYRL